MGSRRPTGPACPTVNVRVFTQPGSKSVLRGGDERSRPGNLARHLSRREVHDKQRLPAFNLLWIWPLLFHADENGARVVAEIDTQPYELLRTRHVLDSENGPDADVDLVEVRGGDEGFDGRRIHVPRFAEARSIGANSVSLKRQPSASRLVLA